jgi:hypothetical protein
LREKWIFLVKHLSIFVYVIFPAFYFITSYLLDFSNPFFVNTLVFSVSDFIPLEFGPIGSLILPIPMLMILLFFSFFQSILPTHKLFNSIGYSNVVIEYKMLKKILIGSIIIIFFLNIILYIQLNDFAQFMHQAIENIVDRTDVEEQMNTIRQGYADELKNSITSSDMELALENRLNEDKHYQELEEALQPPNLIYYAVIPFDLTRNLIFMIYPIPISILVKILLEHYGKFFALNYSKGCFQLISLKKMEIDKARYLLEGLLWYNKFLNRHLNLRINEITKIYSKIITDSPLRTNKDVILLSESFDNKDELLPLRKMTTNYQDLVEQVLSTESLKYRIKESSDLIIPIITVMITVITTFLLPKTP